MSVIMKNSALLVLALLGFAFVSCTEQTASPTASPAKDSGVDRPLVLYTWGDYFSEDALALFTERTGQDVDYQTFENADVMIEHLKSAPENYDVLVVDDVMVKWLQTQKLARRLDHKKLPHMEHIGEKFLGPQYDQGNEYSVPYMWGTTLLAYRSDKIESPGESWKTLLDPTVKGKVMLLEERTDCYPALLLALGYDANSENLSEIEEATDLLVRLVEEQDAVFASDVEIKEALDSGDCWIALAYSGDAASVAEENENVFFLYS